MIQALVDEIQAVLDQDRPVAFIRVTDTAVTGSIVATPVPTDDREMQILVHPDDWALLARQSLSGASATETKDIYGVPVLYD
jgi:hypothetical protein